MGGCQKYKMSYTEMTEKDKKEILRIIEVDKIAEREKREYKKKWHPKKIKRKRGLRKGEWKSLQKKLKKQNMQ